MFRKFTHIIFSVWLFLTAFVVGLFFVDFAKSAPVESTDINAVDWHVFADSDSLISMKAEAFKKPIKMIMATLRSDSYILGYNEKTSEYEAVIKAPAREGKYQIIIRVIYTDGTYEQLEKVVLVEPYGYLYTEKYKPWNWKKPWQIFFKEKIRVSGAAVALYAQNSVGTWVLWPANLYKQKNPQASGDDGEFIFVAPPGRYYLIVKAKSLRKYESGEFEVGEGELINPVIEMRALFSWRILAVILLAGSLMFLAGKKVFKKKKHIS